VFSLFLYFVVKEINFIGVEKVDVDTGVCQMMGFDPLINQRLLPPTFPRYTAIRSHEETVEYFAGLVQRLSQFVGIVSLSDNLHALIVSSRLSFSALILLPR